MLQMMTSAAKIAPQIAVGMTRCPVSAMPRATKSITPTRETMQQNPSPNHNERDPAKPVDILLLHYTGMASGEGAVRWLCNPASQGVEPLRRLRGRADRAARR